LKEKERGREKGGGGGEEERESRLNFIERFPGENINWSVFGENNGNVNKTFRRQKLRQRKKCKRDVYFSSHFVVSIFVC